MSGQENRNASKPPANRWRLWVDGCGGFLVLTGDRWTVGGAMVADKNDIAVGADLPRTAGTILRNDDDYFWENNEANTANAKPAMIQSGTALPIPGSARLNLHKSSPLSGSAVLTLDPPHRFADHIDAVILADQTILVGPTPECNVRGTMLGGNIVMTRRGNRWYGKVIGTQDLKECPIGERVEIGNVALTWETVTQ
ncbi:hypothetical protein CA13_14400 [Planctomycetes bacterium CA13]|uniref:Uncharacterized protein n=1 Tax=Novipirellula herctigrandis TaxID=2527986 RepID=A0A5C5YY55_9BACT|nr:hypothetical protein CA13_14400 [Planctomycetes bacterium CA13]